MTPEIEHNEESELRLDIWGNLYFKKTWFDQELGTVITVSGKNMFDLSRSTGLKDKNGQEIFEGDILLGYSVYPECNIFESKLIGEVYYSSRGTWDCYSYVLGGFNEQVEIIGNVCENPELLAVAE